MRVLLTGFEPFGGDSVNSSQETVRAVTCDEFGDIEIVTDILPVSFNRVEKALCRLIDEKDPENFETYCLEYSDVYTEIDKLHEARILYNIDTTGWPTKLISLIRIARADDMSFGEFIKCVGKIFKDIQLF